MVKKYEAQAIAIVSLLLVVASLIGVSIYSRVLKTNQETLKQETSLRAENIADTILDIFLNIDINTLEESIEDGDMELPDIATIKDYTNSSNVESLLQNGTGCSTGNTNVKVNISHPTPEDFVEVNDGQTKSFRVKEEQWLSGCTLLLEILPVGNTEGIFSIKKIYSKEVNEEKIYKIYEENDIKNYCFSNEGTNCNGDNFSPETVLEKFVGQNSIAFDLNETIGEYTLDEIRITTRGGNIGIKVNINNEDCFLNTDLRPIKVVASVTCGNIYKAKQVLLSKEEGFGYPTLFDYTIFNNVGDLQQR